MKEIENRIARFIESLPTESEVGKAQASLLVAGMGLDISSNGTCYNNGVTCNKSVNSHDCQNVDPYCVGAANEKTCRVINNGPVSPNT